MIKNHPLRLALAGLLTTGLLAQAQDSNEDGEVFELSPFSVDASDDIGYRATTTLAGSRVRSNINDLGASISVVTSEFLEDTGATDGESLLSYVGNVEVGGTQGNFSNVDLTNQSTNESRNNPQRGQRVRGLVSATLTRDYFQTDIPFDSYNTERVTVNRGPNSVLFGLGSPGGIINNSTKRAYIGSENTEFAVRFDHRGSFRGSFDIGRTLIDDRLAIRIAGLRERQEYKQDPAFTNDSRIYMAWDATLFRNENSNFLGRTSFRGNIEIGDIQSNPPDVVPPNDGFSSWWLGVGSQEDVNNLLRVPGVDFTDISNGAVTEAQVRAAVAAGIESVPDGQELDAWAAAEGRFIPQTTINRFERGIAGTNNGGRDNVAFFTPYFLFPAINYNNANSSAQGWDTPDLAGIQGIMARWRPNGFSGPRDLNWTAPATGGAGFSLTSIQNREIFDYHNLLFQGTTNEVQTDFDLYTAVFEQEFLNGRGGLELAFDRQERQQSRFNAFSSGNSKQISIDINEYHAPGDMDFDGVADSLPNENLGRPVVRWNDNTRTVEWNEQDTFRATLFATLDFKDFIGNDTMSSVLGTHTVTGLYEDRTNDSRNRQSRGAWWADQGDYPGEGYISNGANDNFRRIVKSQVYLGPDARGFSSPDQVRIDSTINTGFPKIGDVYGIWYFDNRGSVDAGVQNNWRIIENLQGANISQRNLESKAFTLQSKFFDGNVIGMWARRNDQQEAFRRLQETTVRGPTGSMALRIEDPGINETDGNFNVGLLSLEDDPFAVDEDSTTTWSGVVKYPENWLDELPFGMDITAHYYEAESFEPGGGQVNVLNQPLASPFGETTDKGATITLFDGKLSIRYNEFETVNAFARTNLEGGLGNVMGRVRFFIERITEAEESGLGLFPDGYDPDPNVSGDHQDFFDNPGNYTASGDAALKVNTVPSNRQRATGTDADIVGAASWDAYYARLIQMLPSEVQNIYGYEVVRNADGTIDVFSNPLSGSLQSTNDFVATGKEIDIAGRVTDNISVAINLAQQKTVTSNTGPVAIPLAETILQNIHDLGLYDVRDSPFQTEQGAVGASRYEGAVRVLRTAKAKDGTQSPEQREWRANVVVRYDFLDGFLKGFQVGGGLRYQDKVAAGYPNIMDGDGIVRPDVSRPWFGPDEINGDLFFRYRRPIMNEKVDWSVQFNARNLYRSESDNDITVTINPDGRVAIIRIPNEQQFFLTNTFRF